MILRYLNHILRLGFFFNFLLFFFLSTAFMRVTRDVRETHGWAVYDWRLDDLEFHKASSLLIIFPIAFLIGFANARRRRRRAERETIEL